MIPYGLLVETLWRPTLPSRIMNWFHIHELYLIWPSDDFPACSGPVHVSQAAAVSVAVKLGSVGKLNFCLCRSVVEKWGIVAIISSGINSAGINKFADSAVTSHLTTLTRLMIIQCGECGPCPSGHRCSQPLRVWQSNMFDGQRNELHRYRFLFGRVSYPFQSSEIIYFFCPSYIALHILFYIMYCFFFPVVSCLHLMVLIFTQHVMAVKCRVLLSINRPCLITAC